MESEIVSTNEIMGFLKDHMVTKEEFNGLEVKVDNLEVRFDNLEVRFDNLEVRFDNLEVRFDNLEVKVDGLDRKLNETKLDLLDAMDDKLADLKGHLIILMRKEDMKVNQLITLLHERDLISKTDFEKLLEFQPFPQSV